MSRSARNVNAWTSSCRSCSRWDRLGTLEAALCGFAAAMTQELPAGVVTMTEKLTSDLQGLGDVDVDDIAQLWKGAALLTAIQKEMAC